MVDRPILFSAPMVRALLDGRKTQTRRMLKPQPVDLVEGQIPHQLRIRIGSRLWVRETWRPFPIEMYPWDINVLYAADNTIHQFKDGETGDRDWNMPKAAERGNVPSLFMPRWASRITLTVTDIRVQRLQDISEEDATAEGCKGHLGPNPDFPDEWDPSPTEEFRALWDHINGPGAWDANPWVAVYTFTTELQNIDRI